MWILEPVWKQDYDRGEKEGGQQQGWILPGCYIEYCKYLIVCLFMIHFPTGILSHIFQNNILCLLLLFYWRRRLE